MSKVSGTGWLSTFAPAIGVIAGMMVVTGIYLLDPSQIDLGCALNAKRTWPVGAFLIAAGAALAFKLMRPKGIDSGSVSFDLFLSFVLGDISHFAYGFIAAGIGAQALFGAPANYWAALLLVPGLLSLAIAFSDDDEGTDDDAVDAAEESEGNPTASESGKADLRGTAWASVIAGGFLALYLFAFMTWMFFAFWFYAQLKQSIIDGETADAASVPLWAAVVNALPTLVPLGIGLALFLVAIMFIAMVVPWPSRRTTPASNRGLSAAETAYVDASVKAVRAYARVQGYDRTTWIVSAFSFASVMIMIGVGAAAMFAGIAMLEAPADHASFPLEIKPGGVSAIIGFFAFILAGILPSSILARLSRHYSERAAWVSLRASKYTNMLSDKLISFVRSRRLSTATPINPGEFLHALNLSVERYFYVSAAVVTAAALFLLHRDLNAVDVLTADAIEVTDYWTLAKERYTYGDVRQVELRCFLTDKGEPVEAYVLHFRDGQKLDVYKKQAVVERQLKAYEAVDAKLAALGVPFVPGAHQGLFKSDVRGYDHDCVETLAASFPEELKAHVRQLFHLDDMRAVEDIWPWDDELAQAWRAADKYEVDKAVALYTKAIASGRLTGHLLAVAYFGRAEARDNYEVAYGIRDAEMILALRDYQRARDIEPMVRTYRWEGSAYIALGAYDEAKAAYRRALELDKPKPHWSLIGLARVERIQGHYDAAMKQLDELLRVWGEDNASMPIYFHRAYALYLKKDFAGAADAITKGLAYQTDYADAYQLRACATAQLGDFTKAKADIAQAIKLAHAPPINEAWEKTPQAKAYFAQFERDRTIIEAMEAGSAGAAEQATLCTDNWNYGEELRQRSPLLPAGG